MEGDFGLFELIFVSVDLSGELTIEYAEVVARFIHTVIEIVKILHSVKYQRLSFMFPSVYCRLCSLCHYGLECLAFFQLCIILRQEIFEVIKRNVHVFIGVLHVFVQFLH